MTGRPCVVSTLLASCAISLLTSCGQGDSTPATSAASSDPVASLPLSAHRDSLPLGMVHLTIDAATGDVAVGDLRQTSAIGDAWLVGLNALSRNFRVTGIERTPALDGGADLTLSCEFKHPFSLATRPDLFGWDLKAIVAGDGILTPIAGTNQRLPAKLLLNPAGYTTEWTPEIQSVLPALNANTFPYILLGEDRSITQPFDFQAPGGFNVFPSGGTNAGELVVHVPPAGTVELDLFFTVGYQVSAVRATRQTPNYQPPLGNSRAPWRVEVDVEDEFLDASVGSVAPCDIRIWDWQHGLGMSSDVDTITVHAPDLLTTPRALTISGGTGRDTDPLTASTILTNELGTFAGGETYVLVEVADALHENNPGGTGGEPGVGVVGDDFASFRDIDDLRTFQLVAIEVGANVPGADPIAAVTSCPPLVAGALQIPVGFEVTWDATTSSDPDPGGPEGTIVGWEWDFEWNGVPANFVDDTAGAGTAIESHIYNIAGSTNLGLRVEDGVGRKSPILPIPVTVGGLDMVLTLQAIENLVAWGENRREYGPSLTQESDGTVAVTYTGELGTNYENGYSAWNGSSWGVGGYNYSSGGAAEFGWFMKSNPNWLNGNVLNAVAYTSLTTHEPTASAVFGYVAPGFNLTYGIATSHSYAYEIVGHRNTGHVYAFGDLSSQVVARRGGPNGFGIPVFNWPGDAGAVPPYLIDNRPSVVSRNRSADSAADGSIHLAYRAQDGSQVRYAKDALGLNTSWATFDLASAAPGAYGDPAISHDEGIGVYVAAARNTGSAWQVEIFISDTMGASWSPAIVAGPTFTPKPMDLSLSVRRIACQRVICVGYSTSLAPATSEIRARWSRDAGANWNDVLLSGTNGYAPDTLVTRSGGQFYGTWAADVSGRSNVLVRRGQFVVQ